VTSNALALFGFATGGATAPHFVEPVFIDEGQLVVQSKSKDGDEICDFVLFIDEVEVVESNSEETVSLGDRYLYAIRDQGGTIVYGDRNFVTRYLQQNLRNYLFAPFFLSEAAEFSKRKIAEVECLSSDTQKLEAMVFTNSVRRFCQNEFKVIFNEAQEKADWAQLTIGLPFGRSSYRIKHSQNIFERWTKFAQIDAPKLANQSKWGSISESYLDVFSGNKRRANRYTFLYWILARKILESKSFNNNISSFNENYLSKFIEFEPEELRHSHYILPHNHLSLGLHTSSKKHPVSGKRNWLRIKYITKEVTRSIIKKITRNPNSILDISMHVFFISLVIKIGEETKKEQIEKRLYNKDSRNTEKGTTT